MSAQREIREYSYDADVTAADGTIEKYCSSCDVPIYPTHPEPDERLAAYWAAYSSAHCLHAGHVGKFPAKIEIVLYNRRLADSADDPEPVERGTIEEIRQDIELGF